MSDDFGKKYHSANDALIFIETMHQIMTRKYFSLPDYPKSKPEKAGPSNCDANKKNSTKKKSNQKKNKEEVKENKEPEIVDDDDFKYINSSRAKAIEERVDISPTKLHSTSEPIKVFKRVLEPRQLNVQWSPPKDETQAEAVRRVEKYRYPSPERHWNMLQQIRLEKERLALA